MNAPLMLAYGCGVDSTAVLAGLYLKGIRPDANLFADTRAEKKETYAYLPVIQEWLKKVDFPPITVVENRVSDFKHWPPYRGLLENCLTNGTLPSLAFGFKSCSLKWKVQPQNKWTKAWQPAIDCWAAGGKVRKMIGYDAGAKDRKRYAHAKDQEDKDYDYWYPLIEWGLDREGCKDLIRSVGLPVPPKSACVFCPATQPEELHQHRKEYLRTIVILEARAAPRLDGLKSQDQLDAEWQERRNAWWGKWTEKHGPRIPLPDAPEYAAWLQHAAKDPKRRMEGDGTAGLWRSKTKSRPAMMTDYIREHGLLPSEEIDMLIERAPKQIIEAQAEYALGADILDWHDFLEQFSPEDALDELPGGCAGCTMIDHSK